MIFKNRKKEVDKTNFRNLTDEEKEFYLLHGEEIFKLTQKNRKVMRYQFDNWNQIKEFRKKNKYYYDK